MCARLKKNITELSRHCFSALDDCNRATAHHHATDISIDHKPHSTGSALDKTATPYDQIGEVGSLFFWDFL